MKLDKPPFNLLKVNDVKTRLLQSLLLILLITVSGYGSRAILVAEICNDDDILIRLTCDKLHDLDS